jgi:general secretion pathway protein K
MIAVIMAWLSHSALLQARAIRGLQTGAERIQSEWLVRSAADLACASLDADARFSSVDHAGEAWARRIVGQIVPVGSSGEAVVDAHLVDLQGRLNLAGVTATRDSTERKILARLVASLGLASTLADDIGDALMQARSQPGTNDAEAVLRAAGIQGTALDLLLPHLMRLPEPTRINLNTANPELLAAVEAGIDISTARALVASRNAAYFRDANDAEQRLAGHPLAFARNAVDVRSDNFLFHSSIRWRNAVVEATAVLRRNSGTPCQVLWLQIT